MDQRLRQLEKRYREGNLTLEEYSHALIRVGFLHPTNSFQETLVQWHAVNLLAPLLGDAHPSVRLSSVVPMPLNVLWTMYQRIYGRNPMWQWDELSLEVNFHTLELDQKVILYHRRFDLDWKYSPWNEHVKQETGIILSRLPEPMDPTFEAAFQALGFNAHPAHEVNDLIDELAELLSGRKVLPVPYPQLEPLADQLVNPPTPEQLTEYQTQIMQDLFEEMHIRIRTLLLILDSQGILKISHKELLGER